jgi:predicted transcriptional regulator
MGRLTPQKVQEIRSKFKEFGSYGEVAEATGVDPRTVKRHVQDEAADDETTKEETARPPVHTEAYNLFSQGKTLLETAISLNLDAEETENHFKGYLRLKGLETVYLLYERVGEEKNGLTHLVELYERMQTEGMSPYEAVEALNHADIIVTLFMVSKQSPGLYLSFSIGLKGEGG